MPPGSHTTQGLCTLCPPGILGHKPMPGPWLPPRRQHKVISKLKVLGTSHPAQLLLGHRVPVQGYAWHRLHGMRWGRSRSCPVSARSYF